MIEPSSVRAIHVGARHALRFLEGVGRPPEWHEFALCRETDPHIFHPAKGESVREAKQTCQACCVRQLCLAEALETDPYFDHGIRGGTSRGERMVMRRQLNGGEAA